MRFRVLCATIAMVMTMALFAGCSDEGSERQRVVCEVEAVNDGVPLVSAYVIDGGDGVIGGPEPDDSYPSDAVLVQFTARPYSLSSMTITENDVYSSFIITGYNLTWRLGENAPVGLDMTPYNLVNAPFYLQVPVNGDAESNVLVADRALKEAVLAAQGVFPWLFDQDFSAFLDLEFIGHDSGSETETTVPAGLLVNFTFAVAEG